MNNCNLPDNIKYHGKWLSECVNVGSNIDILVLNKFTGFDVIDKKIKYFGTYESGLSESTVIHVTLHPEQIGSIEALKLYRRIYIDIDPEIYYRTLICIGLLKEDVEYIKFLIGEELFNTLINN
jgi:hypothetical protein